MSVIVRDGRIILSGTAPVEDAETLLAALDEHPHATVDVDGLASAHFAVVQLLHAAGRPMVGMPEDAFLRDIALAGLIQIRNA